MPSSLLGHSRTYGPLPHRIGSRAHAPRTRLDAEQVAQQHTHEVPVQKSARFQAPLPHLPVVLDQDGEHGGALALRAVAENHDVGVLSQHCQRVVQVLLLTFLNPLPTQLVLHIKEGSGSDVHVESEAAADGAHDVGRASFFAVVQNLAVSDTDWR